MIERKEYAMVIDKIYEMLEPKIKTMIEDAYKQGSEDTIRRFAFVYDEVRRTAIEDAYAEVGAIQIEEVRDING